MSNAHREICSLCHEISRVGFWVPDEIWKKVVHTSKMNDIICLRCFTRLADEKSIQWDEEIKFYPVSQKTHATKTKTTKYWTKESEISKKIAAILHILLNNIHEDIYSKEPRGQIAEGQEVTWNRCTWLLEAKDKINDLLDELEKGEIK